MTNQKSMTDIAVAAVLIAQLHPGLDHDEVGIFAWQAYDKQTGHVGDIKTDDIVRTADKRLRQRNARLMVVASLEVLKAVDGSSPEKPFTMGHVLDLDEEQRGSMRDSLAAHYGLDQPIVHEDVFGETETWRKSRRTVIETDFRIDAASTVNSIADDIVAIIDERSTGGPDQLSTVRV